MQLLLSYLEPAVRAELTLLGEPLAVAWCDNTEVRVLNHLGNAGLGCRKIFSETLKLPPQPECSKYMSKLV